VLAVIQPRGAVRRDDRLQRQRPLQIALALGYAVGYLRAGLVVKGKPAGRIYAGCGKRPAEAVAAHGHAMSAQCDVAFGDRHPDILGLNAGGVSGGID
jgi:hypothetical protein